MLNVHPDLRNFDSGCVRVCVPYVLLLPYVDFLHIFACQARPGQARLCKMFALWVLTILMHLCQQSGRTKCEGGR